MSVFAEFLARYSLQLDRILRVTTARVNTGQWSATEARASQVLLDAEPAPSHYAISASGHNVLFKVTWGTEATRSLDNLIPPFVATLAGTVTLLAKPAGVGEASAAASIARVYGACCASVARTLAVAGDVLQAPAVELRALEACTVTPPSSALVAVPAGSIWPVVPGTVLTSGRAVVSHTL